MNKERLGKTLSFLAVYVILYSVAIWRHMPEIDPIREQCFWMVEKIIDFGGAWFIIWFAYWITDEDK